MVLQNPTSPVNIFAVDSDPVRAANALVNRHVTKMTLETAQMMCSIFPPGEAPYRRTHYNHPCTVWSRLRFANYEWLYHHGMALAAECKYRFGANHRSKAVIEHCWSMVSTRMFAEEGHMSTFVQAMPEEFKGDDPIEAYRRYYRVAKAHLHEWTRREPPEWIIIHL